MCCKGRKFKGNSERARTRQEVIMMMNSGSKFRNDSAGFRGSRLNPFAREWNPKRDRAPEKDRGLFLTFSQGFPLYEYEIFHFFNQMFGRCIERVYIHQQQADEAQYAKVIFHFSYIPMAVLGRENVAKYYVNAKPMWCKRFKPKIN